MVLPRFKDWIPVLIRKVDKVLHPKGFSIAELYTRVSALGTRIPNVVYQTWKFPKLAAPHARTLKKFRKRNWDFTFEFYDDTRAAEYMETHYADHPILKVFRYVKVPAAKADLWRYCILYKEGGMYCDIDSLIKIPLREFLKSDPAEVLSFEGARWDLMLAPGRYADAAIYAAAPGAQARMSLDYPDNTVLNWFLAFEPGHPALKETIDLIVRNFPFFQGKVFDSVWQGVVHSTGPLALTQGVWKWLESTKIRPNQRGIDFNGDGVFKIPGDGERDKVSPYYADMQARVLG